MHTKKNRIVLFLNRATGTRETCISIKMIKHTWIELNQSLDVLNKERKFSIKIIEWLKLFQEFFGSLSSISHEVLFQAFHTAKTFLQSPDRLIEQILSKYIKQHF